MITFKPHEIFDQAKPHLPDNPIVVEAGAFDGHDTLRIMQQWPNATVHSFEPVPAIFKQLEKNTTHIPNVHCYQLALSNQNGTAPFYLSEKPSKPGMPSQAGSLHKPKERLKYSPITFSETIQAPTCTLDTWAEQHKINAIDMLWLDMQGHELAVMQAAPHMLKTVKVVYTEVAFVESYANIPQYDEVHKWLVSQGFTLFGKDFPDTPTWFFGNALFVR